MALTTNILLRFYTFWFYTSESLDGWVGHPTQVWSLDVKPNSLKRVPAESEMIQKTGHAREAERWDKVWSLP